MTLLPGAGQGCLSPEQDKASALGAGQRELDSHPLGQEQQLYLGESLVADATRSSAIAMVTLTSPHSSPSLPILWKDICKRHLHGFTVTHKCPGSLQTVYFHHNRLMRSAQVPTLPHYTEAWGRGGMDHGHSKPRSSQDGASGCLHPTPGACAIKRTPNPLQFRLCPVPGAS